jgi:murein DD-endopeptidase MepM/ murein hydrolase activator NlpD
MGRARRLLVAFAAALTFCGPASAHTDAPWQLGFEWPALGTITSPFGNDHGRWHPGLDIGILRSLAVRAAAAGTVTLVGEPPGFMGYGNVVVIDVAPGFETIYAHLASADVRPGDVVTAGEMIGIAGCTGLCFGTHLHFELRQDGRAIDPLQFLR